MKVIENLKNYAQKVLGKPEMGELSSASVDRWGLSGLGTYNPDDLIGKKGLDIYRQMQDRDGQVKAVFLLKKFARLSTPWHIDPAEEDNEEAERQAEFIDCNFEQMKGSVYSFLLKIWNAMRDGYSIGEINYYVIPDGEFAGMIGLQNIKVRKARNYNFDCDEHGNLKENGLLEGVNRRPLPVNKFIILSYNPDDDDSDSIYGKSDFRAAYRYYFSNDVLQRFWNIFLEKFGQPTVIGRYPPGTPDTKQDDFLAILGKIQSDTKITIPENLKVDLLEATRRGDAGYKSAFDTNNAMIARALLVGTLLMDTGKKGSWALSKTHFDIFIYVLEWLGKETEDTIMHEQLIKPLIYYNFATPLYPKFRFESLIQKDQKYKAEICKMLVEGGFINPEEAWVRGFLDLPAREEGVELPPPKGQLQPFTHSVHIFSRKPNALEKKVNFAQIIRDLVNYESEAAEDLKQILLKQREALKKLIAKKEILEKRRVNEVEKIQLSYVGDFRDRIRDWLVKLFEYGKDCVKEEIKRAKKEYQGEPLGMVPEKALQYLKTKSISIAGYTKDAIVKEGKELLYQGLKQGWSTYKLQHELDEMFKKFIGGEGLELKDGKPVQPYRLEATIRTNFSDAYNQGRFAEMNDPAIAEMMAGYGFSAVMDEATTLQCQLLDGKVFAKGDPAVMVPPLDFSCRSILVPVLLGEQFEVISPHDVMKARALNPKGFYK